MATGSTMCKNQLQSCQKVTAYSFCFVPLKRVLIRKETCIIEAHVICDFFTTKDYLILFHHQKHICGLE